MTDQRGVGRPRTITADQERRIVIAYLAGQSIRAIATAEHLSYSGTRYCLRRTGIQLRQDRRYSVIDDDAVRIAADRYYDGVPIGTIAATLGCSPATAYRALHRAGVAIRPPGPVPRGHQ